MESVFKSFRAVATLAQAWREPNHVGGVCPWGRHFLLAVKRSLTKVSRLFMGRDSACWIEAHCYN